MDRSWYLVIGLAKTGTTAVAMTLRNTLRIEDCCMEPSDFPEIEAKAKNRLVIKILFDHWQGRSHQLSAHFRDLKGYDLTTIAIVRDPRDEAISRLHYVAYDYFSKRPTTLCDRTAWLDIFYRKEDAPKSLGLIDMQRYLQDRFGVGFLASKSLYESYSQFIEADQSGKRYVLHYEDFISNSVSDERLQHLLSGSRHLPPSLRRVFRTGSNGQWRDFLTDDDLICINAMCSQYLRCFGYPLTRDRKADGRDANDVASRTGSEYVAKLIDEARHAYEKNASQQ